MLQEDTQPTSDARPHRQTAHRAASVARQMLAGVGWLVRWPAARSGLLVVGVALLLLLVQSLLLSTRLQSVPLASASRTATFLLTGTHAPEADQRGAYRWTTDSSSLRLVAVGQGGLPVLTVQMGPAPPTAASENFSVAFAGHPHTATIPISPHPRRYLLTVPPAAFQGGNLVLSLRTPTVTTSADPRPVGLRLEGASLRFSGTGGVVLVRPGLAGLQLLALALVAALLARVQPGLSLRHSGAVLLLAAGLLCAGLWWQPLLFPLHLARLVPALALLALLTWVLLPLAACHLHPLAAPGLLRLLWGIALLACGMRLVGALYPLFGAFDLGLNLGRLETTITGNLIVTSRSIEFRNGITIYPPGPYISLMPGLLAGISPKLLVQGGVAIIDGFGALAVGLLARQIGGSQRAAAWSALLFAVLPLNLTVIWFGLTAQIFGQALMTPLAIALLLALQTNDHRDTSRSVRSVRSARSARSVQSIPWAWVVAGVLLGISLLSHIGVAVLAVGWLGLWWLLVLLRPHTPARTRWQMTYLLALPTLFSFAVTYSNVVFLKFGEFITVGEKIVSEDHVSAGYRLLVWNAFRVSYHDWGLLLACLGLVLLLLRRRRLPPYAGSMLLAWLGTLLVFLAIELFTALQVRYLYLVVPLVCIAIALLLDQLTRRAPRWQVVAWALLLLLLWHGASIWYLGTFYDVMMDMTPLVR